MDSIVFKVTKKYFKKHKYNINSIYFNVTCFLLYINLKLLNSNNSNNFKEYIDVFFEKYDFDLMVENIDNNKSNWNNFFIIGELDKRKILINSFDIYVNSLKNYFNITYFSFFYTKEFDKNEYEKNIDYFNRYSKYMNDFMNVLKVIFPKNFSDISVFIKSIKKGIDYENK